MVSNLAQWGTRVLTRLSSWCQLGCQALTEGGIACSQVRAHSYGRIQFLIDCRLEALSHSPASPEGSSQHDRLASIKVSAWEGKIGWARWKPESFCNLTLEMTSYHFYQVLLIRSMLLDLAELNEREYNKGIDTSKWVSLGAILKAAYYRCLMILDLKINLL